MTAQARLDLRGLDHVAGPQGSTKRHENGTVMAPPSVEFAEAS